PILDLATERTRYMKEFARGWSGLGEDRLDVGALITKTRRGPGEIPLSPVDIARVKGRAMAFAMRTQRAAELAAEDDAAYRKMASRAQTLKDRVNSGHPPADWSIFMRDVIDVEADKHAGTMGWADEAFYTEMRRFFDAQKAPPEAKSALRFMHGVAAY